MTPYRLGHLLLTAKQGDADAYLELAEEMEEKDLHYASVISSRKRAVAGLEITVEEASDDPDDVAAADLIRDFLDRDDLSDELIDVLSAIDKGYSVTEIVWDNSYGQWMPKELTWRDLHFFSLTIYDKT